MRIGRFVGACAVLLGFFLVWMPEGAATAKSYKVEDFARLQEVLQPRLSPDGKHLAILQRFQDRHAIFIYKLDSNEPPSVIPPGEKGNLRISRYQWVTNDRLVVAVAYPYMYFPPWAQYRSLKALVTATRTIAVDRDGSNVVVLFEEEHNFLSENLQQSNILDILENDPDHILMADDINRDGFVTAQRVNIHTGKGISVARGGYYTFNYQTDWDGQVRLRFDGDAVSNEVEIYLRSKKGTSWKLISRAKSLSANEMRPFGFSIDDPNLLYVATRSATSRRGVYLLNVRTGEIEETVFEHGQVDIDGMSFFHDTHEPVGVNYTDDVPRTYYLSDRAKERDRLVRKYIPGSQTTFVSFSNDGNRQIVFATSEKSPPVYYLMDYEEKSISEIGRWYPQLRDEDMGEVRPYYFAARDGLEIPAYLTLPKGRTRNLPTIIMPHGGPRSRDGATFDYMAQLFANRGYAVIQPNFRGSEGYGEDFEHAGFKEWGLKMQDDVTDATLKAIEDGIADPKRICIVGWSYGGYASAMGVVKEPSLYKCSVAINGVYDLIEVMNRPAFFRGYHRYWGRVIGNKNSGDRPYMENSSPALRAHEIQVPVLLITGELDTIVRSKQAEIFEEALVQAGKRVEAHYYPNSDHSLRYEPERIDAFKRIDAFLARHLKR